eukprot:3693943-Prymnesium_polylepis.1
MDARDALGRLLQHVERGVDDAAARQPSRRLCLRRIVHAARPIRLAQAPVMRIAADCLREPLDFVDVLDGVHAEQLVVRRGSSGQNLAPSDQALPLKVLVGMLRTRRLLLVRPLHRVSRHLLVVEQLDLATRHRGRCC